MAKWSADLGIVENALVGMHPAVLEDRAGEAGVGRARAIAPRRFLDRAEVILRQVATVSTRIGQGLVLFVERLGDAQGVLGAESRSGRWPRVAARSGRRASGRPRSWACSLLRRHRAGRGRPLRIAVAVVLSHRRSALACSSSALLEFFVEPAPAVRPGHALEFALDFPVVARDEGADAGFAFDHDGQRWRLHAAYRRLCRSRLPLN
jgi:hypothetical protein